MRTSHARVRRHEQPALTPIAPARCRVPARCSHRADTGHAFRPTSQAAGLSERYTYQIRRQYFAPPGTRGPQNRGRMASTPAHAGLRTAALSQLL